MVNITLEDYSEIKGEISGFGGGYEQACRKMVIAGLNYLNDHPIKDTTMKQYQNVYGILPKQSDEIEKLIDAIAKGEDGCTGAMVQACLSHTLYIWKNGWVKYKEEMNKED